MTATWFTAILWSKTTKSFGALITQASNSWYVQPLNQNPALARNNKENCEKKIPLLRLPILSISFEDVKILL